MIENLGRKTEISNFQNHVICKEEISKLEISVDNFTWMDVLDCSNELENVVAGLYLVQASTSLYEIRKWLVFTDI